MSKRYCVSIAVAIAVVCHGVPALGQWPEIDKLLSADGAPEDLFGCSVCVSGGTAVVGASYDDDNGNMSGSAYVFQKSGSSYVQVAKLLPSDGAAEDWFGCSVSVSGDTIVIGAPGHDDAGIPGSAYVFERPAGGWPGTLNEDARLLASDGLAGDYFGCSLSICDATVVVGAYASDANGTRSGSAYVFERPVGGWSGTLNEHGKLTATDGAQYDHFGESVSLSGQTVVVGAPYDDDNGSASGSAYVFQKSGSDYVQAAKLLPGDGAGGDFFGNSVWVSDATIVAGARYDDDNGDSSGSAYVFERPAGGWSGMLSEDAKLLPSDGVDRDYFGNSVAAFGDTIVVGAWFDDDNGDSSGSAYVFERPGGGWSGTLNEDAKLLASDGAQGDYLGWSASISDDTIVVGAPVGSHSGSTSIFVRWLPGDVNCDGAVNLFDIDPFVLALTSASNPEPFDDYYSVWPNCYAPLADINGDGSINLFDIDPFVHLLTS